MAIIIHNYELEIKMLKQELVKAKSQCGEKNTARNYLNGFKQYALSTQEGLYQI